MSALSGGWAVGAPRVSLRTVAWPFFSALILYTLTGTMRLLQAFLGLIVALSCVAAWSKDDYELFDLISSLEAAEGMFPHFFQAD